MQLKNFSKLVGHTIITQVKYKFKLDLTIVGLVINNNMQITIYASMRYKFLLGSSKNGDLDPLFRNNLL